MYCLELKIRIILTIDKVVNQAYNAVYQCATSHWYNFEGRQTDAPPRLPACLQGFEFLISRGAYAQFQKRITGLDL